MNDKVRLTPMLEQYLSIKKNHPDALLFYRMGDFYELFFEDAEVAARELQIALTSRNPNAENPVPMCGIPWHAAENYVNQLVNKGYYVAFCDQIEDPKEAKGLVARAVTRVFTPGTLVEDQGLEPKAHSYLGAMFWDTKNDGTAQGGFAWLDVSTGAWTGILAKKLTEIWQWVHKISPAELIVPEGLKLPATLKLASIKPVLKSLKPHYDLKLAEKRILAAQNVQTLATLGLEKKPELIQACGALLDYLSQTQMQDPKHLSTFAPLQLGKHLIIDEVTERTLEVLRRQDGKKGLGTLLQVLDYTATPMGGRLLEDRLQHPWSILEPIILTQEAVAWFLGQPELLQSLEKILRQVLDLERLSTRISLNRTSPKDFLALRQSLQALPELEQRLKIPCKPEYPTASEMNLENHPKALRAVFRDWDNFEEERATLVKALVDAPPQFITEGGLFKFGFNPALDELITLVEHGQSLLDDLLKQEQKHIPKLKLGFNRVFGYYFELSKSVSQAIPEHFVRRQSLVNAERFTTQGLQDLEEKILKASDERKALEFKLYQDMRTYVNNLRPRLMFMAEVVARLDYWQALAKAALKYNWTCPQLNLGQELEIKEGRHPVLEAILGQTSFVPNDLTLNSVRQLVLITGPNMAGKSTILRQTALICLLAQIGSFVPASSATLGLCDKIFSRVGASDNLAQGQSTFMVEMIETARILRQATPKSLIILDEIGRGTSTFDGLALAFAVAEDLAKRTKRTLFATHYHELVSLEGQIPGIITMNVAIREQNGELIFLHRLIPGPSDRSYGIEVAKLAGVPMPVVKRAKDILLRLEQQKGSQPRATLNFLPGMEPVIQPVMPLIAAMPPAPDPAITPDPGIIPDPAIISDINKAFPVPSVLEPSPLEQALAKLDPNTLTPLEALSLLTQWKNLWGNYA